MTQNDALCCDFATFCYKLPSHANVMRAAVEHTLNVERVHTPDLGGNATSADVMLSVTNYLKEYVRELHAASKE